MGWERLIVSPYFEYIQKSVFIEVGTKYMILEVTSVPLYLILLYQEYTHCSYYDHVAAKSWGHLLIYLERLQKSVTKCVKKLKTGPELGKVLKYKVPEYVKRILIVLNINSLC